MAAKIDSSQRPSGRARLEDALAWIDAHAARLEAEILPLAQAVGRALAADVAAAVDVPPFDRAAADGLALRADETVGASIYNPIPLGVIDAAGPSGAARAVRVHAGDQLPRGADAVALAEQVEDDGAGTCCIVDAVAAGAFVEHRASHAARGNRVAAAGRRLRPADIGLLASAGIAQVQLVSRPRIRCVLTGRGVAGSDVPPQAGTVPDANAPLLASLTARDGAVLLDQCRTDRSVAAIREALTSSTADVVLVAGSSGPGADDHAVAALAEAGDVAISGVALRPGETSGLGRTASGALVFLLPGAPAACLWSYELLAGRAVRRLGGGDPALPFTLRAMTAARKIISEIGMTEVCPVSCASDGTVAPIASFMERGLAAATGADGFVIIPEGSEGYAQGARVMVYLYDGQRPVRETAPQS